MSRAVMQQALEMLEELWNLGLEYTSETQHKAAIDDLRAALAEPEQEPVAYYIERVAPGRRDHGTKLGPWWKKEQAEEWVDEHHVLKVLQSAPTPRKPLTDEEIGKIAGDCLDAWSCARAIERAHGIGEQT